MNPLEDLLGACVDDLYVLERAGDLLDGLRRSTLDDMARDREHLITELRSAGTTLRGTPLAERSWAGIARGVAFDAWVLAAGTNTGDVIRSCRRSRDRLESKLSTALDTGAWTASTHGMLVDELERVRTARGLLVHLQ